MAAAELGWLGIFGAQCVKSIQTARAVLIDIRDGALETAALMVKFENADLLLNASKADATQKIMRATSGRDVIAVLDFVGSAKTLLPQVRGHKKRLRNYRLAQPRGAPHTSHCN